MSRAFRNPSNKKHRGGLLAQSGAGWHGGCLGVRELDGVFLATFDLVRNTLGGILSHLLVWVEIPLASDTKSPPDISARR